jgi:drug/metabolite transporter (DMT)-like permease
MVSTPMIVQSFSNNYERANEEKNGGGILLGPVGTGFFLYGKSIAPQAGYGNFLVLLNAISYGFYLIIVKKLMNRYNAFTLLNGFYLFDSGSPFDEGISNKLE